MPQKTEIILDPETIYAEAMDALGEKFQLDFFDLEPEAIEVYDAAAECFGLALSVDQIQTYATREANHE